jgi:hypothetical protein
MESNLQRKAAPKFTTEGATLSVVNFGLAQRARPPSAGRAGRHRRTWPNNGAPVDVFRQLAADEDAAKSQRSARASASMRSAWTKSSSRRFPTVTFGNAFPAKQLINSEEAAAIPASLRAPLAQTIEQGFRILFVTSQAGVIGAPREAAHAGTGRKRHAASPLISAANGGSIPACLAQIEGMNPAV